VAGTVRSGVVVESTSPSIDAGSTLAIAMALRADSTESDAVDPPTWRRLIPVRSVIHSSLVSIIAERSSLVSTFSGNAVPQPMMRPPVIIGSVAMRQVRASPVVRLHGQ
jgi:hypothetical protein